MKSTNSEGYFRVDSESDMPTEAHYAVIEFGSIYIEGDERSRTAPGHGYPGHSQSTRDYLVFPVRAAWEAYITKLKTAKYGKTSFVALVANPASITQKVEVEVKIN